MAPDYGKSEDEYVANSALQNAKSLAELFQLKQKAKAEAEQRQSDIQSLKDLHQTSGFEDMNIDIGGAKASYPHTTQIQQENPAQVQDRLFSPESEKNAIETDNWLRSQGHEPVALKNLHNARANVWAREQAIGKSKIGTDINVQHGLKTDEIGVQGAVTSGIEAQKAAAAQELEKQKASDLMNAKIKEYEHDKEMFNLGKMTTEEWHKKYPGMSVTAPSAKGTGRISPIVPRTDITQRGKEFVIDGFKRIHPDKPITAEVYQKATAAATYSFNMLDSIKALDSAYDKIASSDASAKGLSGYLGQLKERAFGSDVVAEYESAINKLETDYKNLQGMGANYTPKEMSLITKTLSDLKSFTTVFGKASSDYAKKDFKQRINDAENLVYKGMENSMRALDFQVDKSHPNAPKMSTKGSVKAQGNAPLSKEEFLKQKRLKEQIKGKK